MRTLTTSTSRSITSCRKYGRYQARLKGANIFFAEDVAYQKAAIQEMERMMVPVVPMKPQGDKRARLQVVAPYIKNGTVLFPGGDAKNCSARYSIWAWRATMT